jgi:hypothetical protein
MLRFRTTSIHIKFGLILLLTVGLTVLAGFVAAYSLRTQQLRSTAQAVAEQVLAFRSWVSGSGVIWVDNLQPAAPDFLGQTNCGGTSFYSKNPALATRELSNIVARSSVHARFRVTSDNFRSISNQPDNFEQSAIHVFKTGLIQPPQKQRPFVETYEGDRYRYSVPIKVTENCMRCHGAPRDAPREVIEKYGDQRAFHYRIGDIRGVITVDLPVLSLAAASPILNPLSIGLIVLAFGLNFYLLKAIIVDRVKAMTTSAERMVHGGLNEDLEEYYKKDSRDEIDKLYNAIDLMKRSMRIALDRLKDH